MNSVRRKQAYRKLWPLQHGRCCYCGCTMAKPGGALKTTATVEHLKRASEGGTSRWDNLALACMECNSGRGLTDWFTYASYRRGELATC